MGDMPANVELVPVPLEDGSMPDFAAADLVIPRGGCANRCSQRSACRAGCR